jgi:hypothetical protein
MNIDSLNSQNVLARAARWLHKKRDEFLVIQVAYRRGGVGQVRALRATIGQTGADQLVEGYFVTSEGIKDYLFNTSDFIVGDVFQPPQLLDTITEPDGQAWQVVEIGGEPCWRFSDEYENAIRVHTVSEQVAS